MMNVCWTDHRRCLGFETLISERFCYHLTSIHMLFSFHILICPSKMKIWYDCPVSQFSFAYLATIKSTDSNRKSSYMLNKNWLKFKCKQNTNICLIWYLFSVIFLIFQIVQIKDILIKMYTKIFFSEIKNSLFYDWLIDLLTSGGKYFMCI